MPFCLILGDSIALGIAAAMSALYGQGCDIVGRKGVSAAAIAEMPLPAIDYAMVFISAGSNDHDNPRLHHDLERIRSRFHSSRIAWIYPLARAAAWTVYDVAIKHGDRTISIAPIGTRDGVHPKSYIAAARLLPMENHRLSWVTRSGHLMTSRFGKPSAR